MKSEIKIRLTLELSDTSKKAIWSFGDEFQIDFQEFKKLLANSKNPFAKQLLKEIGEIRSNAISHLTSVYNSVQEL